VRASDDGQANGSSLFGLSNLLLGSWCGLACPSSRPAEFFCVGEDEVHMLVECEHLTRHLSPILQGNFHAVVDKILLDVKEVILPWRLAAAMLDTARPETTYFVQDWVKGECSKRPREG
jgi:hypothetical protein